MIPDTKSLWDAAMSDEKALLAAIWAEPQDDTPRLVYADWLEENGQPERAEFIRVQCELAQFDEWDESPRRDELEKREKRLWAKHAKAWKAGLPKLLQAAPFRRGFPSPRRRALTGTQFLKLTATDLAPAPLWDFRINQAERTIARVAASAHMSRVEILEIHAGEMVNQAVEVLRAANFPNVTHLHLDANWIGEPGVAELAANTSIRHLRELSLYSSNLNDEAVVRLVAAPWFGGLRSLFLGNNPFGTAGLRALVAAAGGGALRQLGVRGQTVGDHGKRFDDDTLATLFQSPHLAGLRQLDLGINKLGDTGLGVLCSERTTFRLRNLQLDNNSLTDRGVEVLAAWPGLADVETLILSSNLINRKGALALAQSPHLTRLKILWLHTNPIADLGRVAQQPLVDRFGDAVKFRW
jgi:uncharacterized protein (TIGR02996 family)